MVSARRFAQCDLRDEYDTEPIEKEREVEIGKVIITCRTAFYTAPVMNTPKKVKQGLDDELYYQRSTIGRANRSILNTDLGVQERCGLVIIDEADRLNVNSLEEVRDFYDRTNISVILIGMPGLGMAHK